MPQALSLGSVVTEEARFQFSPNLLEHLGIAAYHSVTKCLAELTANCYDADATFVEITLPDVLDDNATIEISDDGSGMSSADITDEYLFVGKNRRARGGRSAGGRKVIGSKGIGKFAGFGIASVIEVETVKGGTLSYLRLDRDDLEDVASLADKRLLVRSEPCNRGDGTNLRLRKLERTLELPHLDALRAHLYRALPHSGGGFSIKVNGLECTAEDVAGQKQSFHETIGEIGDVSGFYVLADKRQTTPGLSIRVRGRLVTGPQLFGLTTRSHGFFTAEKIVGEINADFLDPDDSDGLSLINTSRDGFLEDSPTVKELYAWARDFIDRVLAGVSKAEAQRRSNTILENESVKQRLETLPAHIRGTVSLVVAQVVAKLKNEEEQEVLELVDWILRYYQSNVLRELMRAILSADASDTETLGTLVGEWGLKQVSSVVETIRDQVEIIRKLETLMFDNSSLEADIHRLVEKNLWLIKEGLELWSSDQPLKTLLDRHVENLYKGRENLRPDIVCRSRDDDKAIVIEFKRVGERIVMEHVTQALEYTGLIAKHRPNLKIETYVIGREYDPSVLAVKGRLEASDLHLWGIQEVLQRARLRFEKILQILGR